ncbi:1846_t:CDS:2 [Gigaspora margarita]|uniref:1846_t:CDS:1 n=1 Tax=Gigaspora margarita TaxID=4874 RepID=A0ABN7UZ56_GIGMA|nr:1846_t:CDS:2 [Gigaspora margarita]
MVEEKPIESSEEKNLSYYRKAADIENWREEFTFSIPAQMVSGKVQNSSPKNSSRHSTFNMGEEVEVFHTAVENSSPNNSNDDLSDWIQEADSGGWFNEEEKLQIDAEWLKESQEKMNKNIQVLKFKGRKAGIREKVKNYNKITRLIDRN